MSKVEINNKFWLNTLGFLSLYSIEKDNLHVSRYLKGQKVRFSSIDDDSVDLLKIFKEYVISNNNVRISKSQPYTKFLFLLKDGKIDTLDESLIRDLMKGFLPIANKPNILIFELVKKFIDGDYTLQELIKPIYKQIKKHKIESDIKELIRKVRPKVDEDTSVVTNSSSDKYYNMLEKEINKINFDNPYGYLDDIKLVGYIFVYTCFSLRNENELNSLIGRLDKLFKEKTNKSFFEYVRGIYSYLTINTYDTFKYTDSDGKDQSTQDLSTLISKCDTDYLIYAFKVLIFSTLIGKLGTKTFATYIISKIFININDDIYGTNNLILSTYLSNDSDYKYTLEDYYKLFWDNLAIGTLKSDLIFKKDDIFNKKESFSQFNTTNWNAGVWDIVSTRRLPTHEEFITMVMGSVMDNMPVGIEKRIPDNIIEKMIKEIDIPNSISNELYKKSFFDYFFINNPDLVNKSQLSKKDLSFEDNMTDELVDDIINMSDRKNIISPFLNNLIRNNIDIFGYLENDKYSHLKNKLIDKVKSGSNIGLLELPIIAKADEDRFKYILRYYPDYLKELYFDKLLFNNIVDYLVFEKNFDKNENFNFIEINHIVNSITNSPIDSFILRYMVRSEVDIITRGRSDNDINLIVNSMFSRFQKDHKEIMSSLYGNAFYIFLFENEKYSKYISSENILKIKDIIFNNVKDLTQFSDDTSRIINIYLTLISIYYSKTKQLLYNSTKMKDAFFGKYSLYIDTSTVYSTDVSKDGLVLILLQDINRSVELIKSISKSGMYGTTIYSEWVDLIYYSEVDSDKILYKTLKSSLNKELSTTLEDNNLDKIDPDTYLIKSSKESVVDDENVSKILKDNDAYDTFKLNDITNPFNVLKGNNKELIKQEFVNKISNIPQLIYGWSKRDKKDRIKRSKSRFSTSIRILLENENLDNNFYNEIIKLFKKEHERVINSLDKDHQTYNDKIKLLKSYNLDKAITEKFKDITIMENIDFGTNIDGTESLIKPQMKLDKERIMAVLKYNNIKMPSVRFSKNDTLETYIERCKKKSMEVKEQMGDVKISEIDENETELLDKSIEYLQYHTGDKRHGDVAIKFLKSFNVNNDDTEFDEFLNDHKDTVKIPMFSGTGTVAASLVLRVGFTVISDDDESVVGRMLGDGIYISDVINKAALYIGDSGYSRWVGEKGYLLELEATLGEKVTNHRSAGFKDATDGVYVRSPEWCVKEPNKQLKIVKVHYVETSRYSELKRISDTRGAVTEGKYFPKVPSGFKSFLLEEQQNDKDVITFTFKDGNIPIDDKLIDFDEFNEMIKSNDNIHFDTSYNGPTYTFTTEGDTKFVMVPSTLEFMEEDPEGLYSQFKSLLKKNKFYK